MLIVCSGPDTYHAQKKAQELVHAFRTKHDPAGFSTEVLPSSDLDSILNRLSAPSLFAQKRLIRCDGLLSELKIAEVRLLVKRLAVDADQTILVTVEEEPLSSKHEKEFSSVKIVTYAHPLLSGSSFVTVVKTRATELGVSQDLALKIARNTDGNMWLAEQELQKCRANPSAPLSQTDTYEASVFEAAEKFIVANAGWRKSVASIEEPGAAPSVLLSQARTYARVKDNETRNVHPYVAKKFLGVRATPHRAMSALFSALKVFTSSRQGMSAAGEEDALYE